MRIVQYLSGATAGCGVQVGDDVFSTGYPTTLALVEDGDRGLEVAERASGGEPVTVDRVIHPLRPGKIFGSGINYKAHGEEAANFAAPDEPRWDFIKLSSSVIGPGEPIVIPSADDVIIRVPGGTRRFSEYGFAVDYEVEFGVVIGKRAKNIGREDALDHVFGYTVINDVSARSVQMNDAQVDLGKSFDTFCPMGPCIVTQDELPDWQDVRIQSHVGAPSDSTFILRELLERGVADVGVGPVWDPVTVQLAFAAETGAMLTLRLGGKIGPDSGDPLDLTVRVKGLVRDLFQRWPQLDGYAEMPLGDAACLHVEGIDVIVVSLRDQAFGLELFTAFGVDPRKKRLLVLKSANHFRAAYDAIAREVIYVDANGALPSDPRAIPYTRFDTQAFPWIDDPLGISASRS